MRIGLLTSVETRHRYFANAIRAKLPVVAIGYERTGFHPAEVRKDELTPDESLVVAEHFAERARQEDAFFGADNAFASEGSGCGVRMIESGELNSPETLGFLEGRNVDTVVVYGANLIKEPLLGRWPGRIINLHLGLSPYYRGTATNFYPLLNEEPEYVGATIHFIDAGIDTGPILKHARPTIEARDRPHTIGCKTILAGVEAMIVVLKRLERDGTLVGMPQWRPANAKFYLRKDYHPRQVVELYRKLDAGLVQRYVERCKRQPPEVQVVD